MHWESNPDPMPVVSSPSARAARLLAVVGGAIMLLGASPVHYPAPAAWGQWTQWGDQGDGTYRNPVAPADYSDIDAIRVGDTFYAISSTIHVSPGMAVLQSKDLVNWKAVGHVVPDLTLLSPAYAWDQPQKLGRVVWAGSIRHHAGMFWVFFGAPDDGFFMSSAKSPAGPWTTPHRLLSEPGWDDCSALWDDDGQAYFVGTHFADGYKTYIWKMTADGRSIDRASAVLVNEGSGREASKLIKVGGWYYLIYSEAKGGARYVLARRARSPMGPYSEPRQLTEPNSAANEPNQGGIVQGPGGGWYFLTHHGRQDWEGRAMSLLPVTWIDGWPVMGEVGPAGRGLMSWGGAKPAPGRPAPRKTADTFAARTLGPDWEWMRNPRPGFWSLTDRPGFLRLRAWRPVRPDDPLSAGNILTQRAWRTSAARMTAHLDLSGMTDGQHAGLGHFSNTFGYIGVVQRDGVRRIEYRRAGQAPVTGPVVEASTVALRMAWGLSGQASMTYSLDGRRFLPFGDVTQQTRASYRGSRVGVFTYNDQADAGHLDVDAVEYAYDDSEAREP